MVCPADVFDSRLRGDEDGPVVYPANAFDSRLRGDYVLRGSSPTKSQKKKRLLGLAARNHLFIPSYFILFFVFLSSSRQKEIGLPFGRFDEGNALILRHVSRMYVAPCSRPVPYSRHSPYSRHFVQHLVVFLQGFNDSL